MLLPPSASVSPIFPIFPVFQVSPFSPESPFFPEYPVQKSIRLPWRPITNHQSPITNSPTGDQSPIAQLATNHQSAITTFLHISCFDEPHKNVKSLLRAAKTLSEKHSGWQLVLVGTGADYAEVRAYADTLSLPEGMVVWTGELTPRQVSDTFNKADVFVLTSRFENAPVVISESIVKGVPVISTRVGGIPEMVNEGNGLLVSPDSDAELVQAMEYMLTHHTDFNRDVIRRAGDQYSYAAVGRHLKAIYESVLTSAQ